jgi:hypothetical protein
MTHFDGWEDSWASFDEFTVAAFRRKTGLDARKELKLGDVSDTNFRKWVEFRINTLTDFVREIREPRKISGRGEGNRWVFDLPPFERGAVVWIEDTK